MSSRKEISIVEIVRILGSFGLPISPLVAEKFKLYIDLLRAWNEKISLTTVVDPHQILEIHLGESLFVATVGDVEKGRLADVGSGAGFPGLPLAIANDQLDVTLVEPNAKKAAFLAEVIRRLSMRNAQVERSRVPEFRAADKFDFITARAVGNYPGLLKWASQSLLPQGRVILWLGKGDAEALMRVRGWNWRPPVLIPRSRERVLLIGSADAQNVPRET